MSLPATLCLCPCLDWLFLSLLSTLRTHRLCQFYLLGPFLVRTYRSSGHCALCLVCLEQYPLGLEILDSWASTWWEWPERKVDTLWAT